MLHNWVIERNAAPARQLDDATALGPVHVAVAGHDGHRREGRFGAPDQASLPASVKDGAFQRRAKPF